MALLAFVAPILPGKTEQWKQFAKELSGSRRKEYLASRRKASVHERAFLQSMPQGDAVIVTLEGDNPAEGLRRFLTANDPFAQWFAQQVKEIHGLDINEVVAMPKPQLLVDSEEGRSVGA